MPEMDDESRIERRHWGEIGSDEDSSEESDEDEEDAEGITTDSGFITPATTEGFAVFHSLSWSSRFVMIAKMICSAVIWGLMTPGSPVTDCQPRFLELLWGFLLDFSPWNSCRWFSWKDCTLLPRNLMGTALSDSCILSLLTHRSFSLISETLSLQQR